MRSDVRDAIAALLDWEEAHPGFESAVAGLHPSLRGRTPQGLPYSPWQLVEHIRITQHDLLDFCINPDYEELAWPDEYWPEDPAPPSAGAWDDSIARFRDDRRTLQRLTRDPATDLTAAIPHGSGQTYLRELLLSADHTAYHVGELVVARRLLGAWPSS